MNSLIFQDGRKIGQYGDLKGQSEDEMFSFCGNNDKDLRCRDCKKGGNYFYEMKRRPYWTYDKEYEDCPYWSSRRSSKISSQKRANVTK